MESSMGSQTNMTTQTAGKKPKMDMKAMTLAQLKKLDMKQDAKSGTKEDSKADMKRDAKLGIKD